MNKANETQPENKNQKRKNEESPKSQEVQEKQKIEELCFGETEEFSPDEELEMALIKNYNSEIDFLSKSLRETKDTKASLISKKTRSEREVNLLSTLEEEIRLKENRITFLNRRIKKIINFEEKGISIYSNYSIPSLIKDFIVGSFTNQSNVKIDSVSGFPYLPKIPEKVFMTKEFFARKNNASLLSTLTEIFFFYKPSKKEGFLQWLCNTDQKFEELDIFEKYDIMEENFQDQGKLGFFLKNSGRFWGLNNMKVIKSPVSENPGLKMKYSVFNSSQVSTQS